MRKEKKEKNYKKRVFKMLIAAGSLAAILAILLLLRTNVTVAEWMAAKFSRIWISVFSAITSIVPFSLYETLLYVAIIGGIALIVAAIVFFVNKKALRAVTYLLVIVLVGLGVGNIYTLSAGFAYYRGEPKLPYYDSAYVGNDQKEEIIAAAEFMIDDFNALAVKMKRDEEGRTISPYTHRQLADKLIEEYKRLDDVSDYFSKFTPRAKAITSKNIMTHMHITGVFFAPFGEANVNPLTPASDMPVTMAHELAHSKGAMRESDANLLAYWVTLTSDDEYLRYSGYKACYDYMLLMVNVFDLNKEHELLAKLDKSIIKEWELNSRFWNSYTLLDDITEFFNNLYLKSQGQKEGTGSYVEPTLPPDITIVPDDGSVGGDGDVGGSIEIILGLNKVQRMMLRAVEERMEAYTHNISL